MYYLLSCKNNSKSYHSYRVWHKDNTVYDHYSHSKTLWWQHHTGDGAKHNLIRKPTKGSRKMWLCKSGTDLSLETCSWNKAKGCSTPYFRFFTLTLPKNHAQFSFHIAIRSYFVLVRGCSIARNCLTNQTVLMIFLCYSSAYLSGKSFL